MAHASKKEIVCTFWGLVGYVQIDMQCLAVLYKDSKQYTPMIWKWFRVTLISFISEKYSLKIPALASFIISFSQKRYSLLLFHLKSKNCTTAGSWRAELRWIQELAWGRHAIDIQCRHWGCVFSCRAAGGGKNQQIKNNIKVRLKYWRGNTKIPKLYNSKIVRDGSKDKYWHSNLEKLKKTE